MRLRHSLISGFALFLACAGPTMAIAWALVGGFWRMSDLFGLFAVLFVEELVASAFAWAASLYAKRLLPVGSLFIARTQAALLIALVVCGISAIGAVMSFLMAIAIGFA